MEKNTISPVPSCSFMFFEILWPSRFPRAAASVPSPSSGNASTLPGRPCRSHRHIAWQPWQPAWPPAWQPATVRGFFSGLPTWDASRDHPSQAAACEETSHGSSAMMWDYLRCELWGCEQDWTSETCEKILQNQDVPRCPKMCQDVPRCAKMCQDCNCSSITAIRASRFSSRTWNAPNFAQVVFYRSSGSARFLFFDVPLIPWCSVLPLVVLSCFQLICLGLYNALSTEIGTWTPWTCCVSSAKTLQKLRIFI